VVLIRLAPGRSLLTQINPIGPARNLDVQCVEVPSAADHVRVFQSLRVDRPRLLRAGNWYLEFRVAAAAHARLDRALHEPAVLYRLAQLRDDLLIRPRLLKRVAINVRRLDRRDDEKK